MQSSPEVWKEFFETYYRDELNRAAEKAISLNGSTPINVNFLKDLVIFKEGIVAEELLDYPDIVLDHANHGIANSENIHNVKLENSRARVYNLPISRRVLIRDLRSEHISKLVSIDGVVRKVTEVRPRVIEAAFVCSSCAVKMFIYQDDSTIKYPYECKSCGSRKFIFLPEESRSIDSQRMRIQEYPENLRGGEQPQTLDVVLENDLTGIVNPGDRVVINGIVRATPRSVSGKRLRHMDITLEGNSIEVLQQEYEEFEITEEDKKKILEIGNDPEVFDNIVKSIAPVIYGYEDMKMAVALQLFGGIPKKLPDGTEIRGDVHVLLVGDPGVAKSQLLRYVHRIAPRSVYTTGKGTTSAGLCVAPESLIFGENNAYQIGELVESSDLTEYENGIYRSKIDEPIKVQTINPTKTSFKPSNTLWKIRSPEKLIKVRSQTGKEVIATPNTKILVMENGEIKWKRSGEINESDFIATARKLDHKGERVLTLELVKDLDVTVYGVEKLVKDLVRIIKTEKGLTTRELANELGVNENNLYHSWVKESAVGNIDLKTLIKLAEKAEYKLEDVAPKIESFSQFHGHKIKLPQYLDERFLYFAGLIAGDGDISRSPTGGYTIRFSNGDARLRRDFMELTEELFGIKTAEESDGVRIPSIRFGSKIVATILKRLSIPESPKSHTLDMSETLLSLPHKELAAYIRGLFDCDGSIMVRKSGSSCLEFDTTSKNLAEKLHLSLLRFGITSYMRERKCKGEVTELEIDDNARKITRKHDMYELKLYGKNIEKFNEKIGVEHPAKSEKLSKLLTEIGVRDTDGTIASLGTLIKEIRTFYGLSIKEVYGSNIGQLMEKDERQTSITVLKNAVNTLSTANLSEVKIEIPEELRLNLGGSISPEELDLSRERFYECFKRTNRSIRIPAGLLFKAKEKIKDRDGRAHNELSNLLYDLVYQEELIREKLEYLKQLAYSDIVWESVKEKQEIQSPYEYVYDLTVDGSHSFLANGIVVHNTAAATKDEYDGRWTLEAGALVLADKGIALVDEIDKMKADDRGGLHEAMEQQTVSVAKAGINAVLWARCAMLGAANPKYGRFDRYAPIAEQIDLSPTLLSRFDLIFVMTDDPDEARDRALAKHILDSHELGEKLEKLKNIVSTEYDHDTIMSEAKKIEPAIDPELLRKYIAYSKRTVFPVLTKEVKQTIEDFYSSLRGQAKENTPMPVTARQLEALIRLAEASARLQLKDKVTIEDVNRVIGIVRKSLEQIAVDPETGEMDIDYAFSGTSKTQRDRIMVIKKIVEEIADMHEKGAPEEEVLSSAEAQGINWSKAKDILQKMRMNGEVYCPKPGYFDITHNY
ncbi:MAG: LAGLIDADG family homing endonuclease [Archaeoglobaceae archaeon]